MLKAGYILPEIKKGALISEYRIKFRHFYLSDMTVSFWSFLILSSVHVVILSTRISSHALKILVRGHFHMSNSCRYRQYVAFFYLNDRPFISSDHYFRPSCVNTYHFMGGTV